MFKRKAYLHIGAHKTASTTFQRAILLNSDLLKSEGIKVISPSEIAVGGIGKLFRWLALKVDPHHCYKESHDLATLRAGAKMELNAIMTANPENLLFSWEGFLGHSDLRRYAGIYPHYSAVACEINELFDSLDFFIVMLARAQNGFIDSCYRQQIKERNLMTFDEFVGELNIDQISWYQIYDKFDEIFDNRFQVIPFEIIKKIGAKLFCQGVLHALTGKVINLNLPSDLRSNRSYSNYGIAIALELLPKLSLKNRKLVGSILFKELQGNAFSHSSFMSSFASRMIMNHCATDNKKLLDKAHFDSYEKLIGTGDISAIYAEYGISR